MKRLAAIMLFVLSAGFVQAQEFEDYLDNYTGGNKEGYLQPLADVFIANFNNGWFNYPKIDKGFHVYLGVVGSGALVTSNLKTFTANTENFNTPQSKTVPTVFGDINPVYAEGINGTRYVFPGGFSVEYVPMAIPQLTVGSFLGTEFTVRYFAYDLKGDFGKLDVLGFGARHCLSQYLNSKYEGKFYWNVGYGFQNFRIGEKVNTTSHYLGMDAGRQGKHFFYFGRLAYQTGTMDIKYQRRVEDGGEKVDVALKSKFPVLVGVGGGVTLWKFRIHAAVNYAKMPTGEVGLALYF